MRILKFQVQCAITLCLLNPSFLPHSLHRASYMWISMTVCTSVLLLEIQNQPFSFLELVIACLHLIVSLSPFSSLSLAFCEE